MLPHTSHPGAASVALLAEGVDRNLLSQKWTESTVMSPSSRRAWIEISWHGGAGVLYLVALLAEGVDRNSHGSPGRNGRPCVALLAEGVDRNSKASRACCIFS